MQAARSNQGDAIEYAITILGLANLNGTEAIQALGKCRGKLFWHVLHNDDPRSIGGQSAQNTLQCYGSSG
jgi:hypothetical protein